MAGDVRDGRLFDRDPLTGITEVFYFDPETDGFRIETLQDVEPMLDANSTLANAHSDWRPWQGDWHHVARIPMVVMMQLEQQGIVTCGGKILDEARYKQWLNDRDNRMWRTKPGVV